MASMRYLQRRRLNVGFWYPGASRPCVLRVFVSDPRWSIGDAVARKICEDNGIPLHTFSPMQDLLSHLSAHPDDGLRFAVDSTFIFPPRYIPDPCLQRRCVKRESTPPPSPLARRKRRRVS